MPYPSAHLYLTVRWLDAREPDEMGQFGLRFEAPDNTEATQARVSACASAVSTFWANGLIPGPYQLQSLRLAHVGQDGHYVDGSFSRDHIYNPLVNGTTSTAPLPLQVASVATLLTDRPSGNASRGRIYLPPLTSALGSNGRWTAAQVDQRAQAVATMITSLNNALTTSDPVHVVRASVFSKGSLRDPVGRRGPILGVKVGTRPDVQRRRAKGMAEEYGATKTVAGGLPPA